MKFLALPIGALAALALASTAVAQSGSPAPNASAPNLPAPSPAALEQARHLIQTMHAERMTDQLITTMEQSMSVAMSRNLPQDKQPGQQAFADATFEEIRPLMAKLFDSMATIYATDFTEQELADMQRFYASPTGQSVIAKLPLITQQLIPVAMAEMPGMMSRAFDRYCSKTTCTPEQRAAMAKAVDVLKARTVPHPGMSRPRPASPHLASAS